MNDAAAGLADDLDGDRTRRRVALPFVLVLASLLSLVVAELVVERRSARLWDEIAEVVEPARASLGQIQVDVALETAGVRGFLLTGDSTFAASEIKARTNGKAEASRLASLARQLDEPITDDVTALTTRLRLADGLTDSLFAGKLSRTGAVARLDARQRLLQDVVGITARLDAAIGRALVARRRRIEQTENAGLWATRILVVLALIAAAMVAQLGRAYRALVLRLEERARREAELSAALRDSEERERQRVTESRTRLVRGFTHDVKNPLGAADGYLALLEDGVLGELPVKQKESIARTRRSIHSALDLIAHLIELSRAESGQIEIRQLAVDLRELVGDLAEQFRAQAEKAGLQFKLELPAELPSIKSDAERVRQVLANLMSNAIKYTPAGGSIVVRACVETGDGAPKPGKWVATEVVDTGRGISRDQQHLVFREFARFDSSGTAGVGIGLAISQRIAEALGGRITVESEQGRGSTFTLWLPLR